VNVARQQTGHHRYEVTEMRFLTTSALVCGVVLGSGNTAAAQAPAVAGQQAMTDFSQLGTRLEPGDRVKVDDAGRTIEGRLVAIESGAVRLRFNDQVLSIPADQIRSVAHVRSKAASGAALGVMIGAGSVLTMTLIATTVAEDAGEFDLSGGEIAAATALYAGIGGVAGAIIGRMFDKSETIYVAPPRTIPGTPPSHGAALMFSVRF
jgi:hypothetical protein